MVMNRSGVHADQGQGAGRRPASVTSSAYLGCAPVTAPLVRSSEVHGGAGRRTTSYLGAGGESQNRRTQMDRHCRAWILRARGRTYEFWHLGLVRANLILLTCIIVFVGLPELAKGREQPAEYILKGYISVQSGDVGAKASEASFLVRLSEGKWLIRTEPLAGPDEKDLFPIGYRESGYDGSVLYSLAIYNQDYDAREGRRRALATLKSELDRMRSSGAPQTVTGQLQEEVSRLEANLDRPAGSHAPRNKGVGTVVRTLTPGYLSGEMGPPLWLAFCSGPILRKCPPDRVPAILALIEGRVKPEQELPFAQGRWELLEGGSAFPAVVELTNNGVAYYPAWKEGVFEEWSQSGETSAAVLACRYETVSSTNIGGHDFPQEFRLTRFSSASGPSEQGNLAIIGRVESVQISNAPGVFVPIIPVPIAVNDYRFMSETVSRPVTYIAQGPLWPSLSSVKEFREYRRALASNRAAVLSRGDATFRRGLVLVLLGILIVAPLVWWGSHILRRRRIRGRE